MAATEDPHAWTAGVALDRARLADRASAAAMRVALEWHTAEDPGSAERWLALAWACLRARDAAAAITAARAAAGCAVDAPAVRAEIGVVLDLAAGVDRYQGPGTIRRWPGGRFVVELPGEPIARFAEFHWGHAIGAGVTPADGVAVDVSARVQPARGWRVQAFAPTGEVVRAALTRDGVAVRCGALAYLRLREPCPPPLMRWAVPGWRTAVGALPIGFADHAIEVRWAELGVASWEALAAAHPPAAPPPAPPRAAPAVDSTVGKLTRAGRHLIVDDRPRPLAEPERWPAELARPRGDRWRRITAAVPFVATDDAVQVDWPRLAAMHALPPSVASWPDVAAACAADAAPADATGAPAPADATAADAPAAAPALEGPSEYSGPGRCELRGKRLVIALTELPAGTRATVAPGLLAEAGHVPRPGEPIPRVTARRGPRGWTIESIEPAEPNHGYVVAVDEDGVTTRWGVYASRLEEPAPRWRRARGPARLHEILARVPVRPGAAPRTVAVDWPRLSAVHGLEPAVEGWAELFARFPGEDRRRLRNTARDFPQNHVALLRPEMRERIVPRDALAAAMRLADFVARPTGEVAQLYAIRKAGKSTFLVSHLDRAGQPYVYLDAEHARLHEHVDAALADPHPARVLVEGARRAAAADPAIARMRPVSTGGADRADRTGGTDGTDAADAADAADRDVVSAGAVLILDEIEVAAHQLRDRLAELLRRLAAEHPLVVVGVDPWWPARFLSTPPPVSFAPPWRFELFDAGELAAYGKALLASQAELAPGLTGWLLAQTGGHPTVTRHVVSSLLDWAIPLGRVHRGDTLEVALAEEWWSWRTAQPRGVRDLFGAYLAGQADRLWTRAPDDPHLATIGTLLRAIVERADGAGAAPLDDVLAACAAAHPDTSAPALVDAAVATCFVARDGDRLRLTIPLLHRYFAELGAPR